MRAAGRGAALAEAQLDAARARGLSRHHAGRDLHPQRVHGLGRQPQHAGAVAVAAAAALRSQPGGHRPGAAGHPPRRQRRRAAAAGGRARGRRGGAQGGRARSRRLLARRSSGRAGGDVVAAVAAHRHLPTAGGMLERAETALRVAEKSYKARRASRCSSCWTRSARIWRPAAQYLRALYDFRQAAVDVTHAVGEGPVMPDLPAASLVARCRCCAARCLQQGAWPRSAAGGRPARGRATSSARPGQDPARLHQGRGGRRELGRRPPCHAAGQASPSTRTTPSGSPRPSTGAPWRSWSSSATRCRPGQALIAAVVAQRRADPGRRAEGAVGSEPGREGDRARPQAAGGRRRRRRRRSPRPKATSQGQVRLRARRGAAEGARHLAQRPGGERRAARADRRRGRRAQRAGRAGGARRSAHAAAHHQQPRHGLGAGRRLRAGSGRWSTRAPP